MNLISILGLVSLLLIAWGFSFHKKSINFKPIIWGIGLQFLFALIILKNNYWSFIGMGALGLLIIAYLLHNNQNKLKPATVLITTSVALIFILWKLPTITWFVLTGFVVFLLINARIKLSQFAGQIVSCLMVVGIIFSLVTNDLYGQVIFKSFSDKVADFLVLSDYGAKFLFGNLVDGKYFFTGENSSWPGFGFQFAFKVLPTIIFFGGFMSVMYYLGIMQKIIVTMSHFMRWTIGTSGAETLSCSANIFVGQTEAPLLIKPFLNDMTISELTTIMVGGFATIAGGVLAGYIAMGVPAGHLIAASVMSAPAALVIGKIIFPEREKSLTAGNVHLPTIKVGNNIIEAATNGIIDGLKLAVNVGAMLIGFIALVAVIDVSLNWLDKLIDGQLLGGEYVHYVTNGMTPAKGEYLGFFPGSLQTFFGTVLKPLAFLMGVSWEQADKVGNLLGIKLALNEFVAYGTLADYIQGNILDERAKVIATYALCGFANFASIGIQLGGISAIAPNRKSELAKIGLRAMFGGALASWLTATIAGSFI